MRHALTDPARVSAAWAGAVVAAVAVLTLLFPGNAAAMAVTAVAAVALAAGWYAHMRLIDRSFRVDVCVRPLGRIRF